MPNWIDLTDSQQITQIAELSRQQPCIIYKHSTRCSLSFVTKHRLESEWDEDLQDVAAFFLDVIAHRDISQQVAEHFSVYHESPQLLLIRDGECIYEESHLDISVEDLKENFHSAF